MWSKELTKINRYLVVLVGLLMASVFFTPLWFITLEAPQYPEGLSMFIWVNKITGGTPHDLKNINLLNHYIGMQEIVESSIPELLYMPYILGFMIVGALITYFYPRTFMILLGLINSVLVGAAGLYDFWRWEYNYGHNLKPDAPIIIPGMAYQPPLFACKEMLNITACSWPYIGAIALFLSIGILIFILLKERKMLSEGI